MHSARWWWRLLRFFGSFLLFNQNYRDIPYRSFYIVWSSSVNPTAWPRKQMNFPQNAGAFPQVRTKATASASPQRTAVISRASMGLCDSCRRTRSPRLSANLTAAASDCNIHPWLHPVYRPRNINHVFFRSLCLLCERNFAHRVIFVSVSFFPDPPSVTLCVLNARLLTVSVRSCASPSPIFLEFCVDKTSLSFTWVVSTSRGRELWAGQMCFYHPCNRVSALNSNLKIRFIRCSCAYYAYVCARY